MNLPARLNVLRIEAAAGLLDEPSGLQVTTVMYDVGFGSKSAFQREFRRRFGLTAGSRRKEEYILSGMYRSRIMLTSMGTKCNWHEDPTSRL